MIIYLLLFITYLLPAHAATTHPSVNILNPISPNGLTQSSNQSFANGNLKQGHCTSSDRWNQPAWKQNDCQGVVEYLYHETMEDGGWNRVEFMARGATRIRRMRKQKTPRIYIFGTCTLAIIMLHDFPDPATLPGGFRTGPPTDVTTYRNLNKIAANLVDECVVAKGQAGWRPTGQCDGIGVFVWSTDSEQDREIENDMVGDVFSGLRRVGDGDGDGGTA